MSHLLFVDVVGLTALRQAMGEAVTARALAELHARLPLTLAAVLDRAGGGRALAPERPGRWCAALTCADAEQVDVTRHAAQRLVHDLVAEVFGAATGAWAQVVADVVAFAGDDLDGMIDRHVATVPAAALAALREQVAALIDRGGLRTFVQPIVSLGDARIVGYEALTRGPADHPLERADQLFAAAARTGLSHALECACARQAVPWLDRLPPGRWLSVNASVPLLLEPEMRRVLARPGLVVEITEHLPIVPHGLEPALDALRRAGALIALDDTGCGFADTAAARALRPHLVKLCITVIRGAGQDASILPELQDTVHRFHELGAEVLAEGVETDAQAAALAPLGIDLAQGWLYGRPCPAGSLFG